MQFSNSFETLLTFAEAYSALGYSLVPLLGDRDPSRPKVPAIPWAGFQHYRASLAEQHQWFTEARFAGLGIVTGRISQLVVLDFDSEQVFNDFRLKFPDLTETHTVHSAGRGLPHLYFKLPSHLSLPSTKRQGLDLLSDGCYVVAPPTTINGQTYKITRGGMPKTLTERDVRRIQSFMRSTMTNTSQTSPKLLICNNLSLKHPSPLPLPVTPTDLQTLYHHLVGRRGRNESLFLASLHARNSGWTPQQTEESLLSLHIQQPSNGLHHHETPVQRQREALNTIHSAFSKPARPLQKHIRHKQGALSNSVRETLMQRGMTYFVRTYEGLLLKGVHPGQVITTKESVEKLKGLVGRDSVLKTLQAGQGNRRFFTPVSPHYTVATENSLNDSDKCLSVGSNYQEKVQIGRPQHRYKMPSNAELCAILGVKITGSDVIEQADLTSARKTRMTLHRELIKRRPGQYGKRWLARRLGVNKRSIATYNQLIPIHSRAMFVETPITWKTIERLPFDEPIQGAVLVTLNEKRYPALRTIASRLLARGEAITLKQQTANFYWYGDEEPFIERLHIQQAVAVKQERIEAFIAQHPKLLHNVIEQRPPAPKPIKSKPQGLPNVRQPLKNAAHEAQAQHLYATLNQVSTKCLSLANARRLVATYDLEAVMDALHILSKRQTITNPIGFLVTLLRSASKIALADSKST